MQTYFKIPFINIENFECDVEVVRKFTKRFLLDNAIVPMEEHGNIMNIAIAEVDGELNFYSKPILQLKEKLEGQINMKVLFFRANKEQILKTVRNIYL